MEYALAARLQLWDARLLQAETRTTEKWTQPGPRQSTDPTAEEVKKYEGQEGDEEAALVSQIGETIFKPIFALGKDKKDYRATWAWVVKARKSMATPACTYLGDAVLLSKANPVVAKADANVSWMASGCSNADCNDRKWTHYVDGCEPLAGGLLDGDVIDYAFTCDPYFGGLSWKSPAPDDAQTFTYVADKSKTGYTMPFPAAHPGKTYERGPADFTPRRPCKVRELGDKTNAKLGVGQAPTMWALGLVRPENTVDSNQWRAHNCPYAMGLARPFDDKNMTDTYYDQNNLLFDSFYGDTDKGDIEEIGEIMGREAMYDYMSQTSLLNSRKNVLGHAGYRSRPDNVAAASQGMISNQVLRGAAFKEIYNNDGFGYDDPDPPPPTCTACLDSDQCQIIDQQVIMPETQLPDAAKTDVFADSRVAVGVFGDDDFKAQMMQMAANEKIIKGRPWLGGERPDTHSETVERALEGVQNETLAETAQQHRDKSFQALYALADGAGPVMNKHSPVASLDKITPSDLQAASFAASQRQHQRACLDELKQISGMVGGFSSVNEARPTPGTASVRADLPAASNAILILFKETMKVANTKGAVHFHGSLPLHFLDENLKLTPAAVLLYVQAPGNKRNMIGDHAQNGVGVLNSPGPGVDRPNTVGSAGYHGGGSQTVIASRDFPHMGSAVGPPPMQALTMSTGSDGGKTFEIGYTAHKSVSSVVTADIKADVNVSLDDTAGLHKLPRDITSTDGIGSIPGELTIAANSELGRSLQTVINDALPGTGTIVSERALRLIVRNTSLFKSDDGNGEFSTAHNSTPAIFLATNVKKDAPALPIMDPGYKIKQPDSVMKAFKFVAVDVEVMKRIKKVVLNDDYDGEIRKENKHIQPGDESSRRSLATTGVPFSFKDVTRHGKFANIEYQREAQTALIQVTEDGLYVPGAASGVGAADPCGYGSDPKRMNNVNGPDCGGTIRPRPVDAGGSAKMPKRRDRSSFKPGSEDPGWSRTNKSQNPPELPGGREPPTRPL